MSDDIDPGVLATRIETLLSELESDARSQAVARQLVRSLMQFYGAAFERVVEMVSSSGDKVPPVTIDQLIADPAIATVLALHDLHPQMSQLVSSEARSQPLLQVVRADGSTVSMQSRPRERAAT